MRIALLVCVISLFLFPAASFSTEAYSLDDELIYRINFGRVDDVKLLLDKGANPNTYSSQGDTALTSAINRNDEEAISMAKILLTSGADPNLQDKRGHYPLILAARNGQGETVSALMDKNANFHVKTSDDIEVINVAKQNGSPGVILPIQAALDKEAAEAASLRTPARFKEIIRRYAFFSCSYQYWSYYQTSRQNPERDANTKQQIETTKSQLATLLQQIQTYYPKTKMVDVEKVSEDAAQEIFKILDDMVSNRNRADKNVGKEDDAKQRCEAIATHTKVDFIPVDLK